jgi:hypothetical protein
MIWDARKLDDFSYYLRRVILEASVSSVGAFVFVMKVTDVLDGGWHARDVAILAWAGFMAIYFVFLLRKSKTALRLAAASKDIR